jgi:hypothetical protein
MNKVNKAYKHITTFLLQPHSRDEFLDEHIAIALYNPPMSLYIFAGGHGYFKATVSLNREELWIEEGYKYEK